MSSSVQVVPKEQVTSQVVTSLDVYVERVWLHEGAQIQVRALDASGNIINLHSLKIEGEEYNNWSVDDDYVVNLVCSKLGYQLPSSAPVEEPVVVEPEPAPVPDSGSRNLKKNRK